MNMIGEEYQGFTITTHEQRILGTIHPVFAEVRNKSDRPELERLLKKPSGDLVSGNSPQGAIDNAKKYIDGLLNQKTKT